MKIRLFLFATPTESAANFSSQHRLSPCMHVHKHKVNFGELLVSMEAYLRLGIIPIVFQSWEYAGIAIIFVPNRPKIASGAIPAAPHSTCMKILPSGAGFFVSPQSLYLPWSLARADRARERANWGERLSLSLARSPQFIHRLPFVFVRTLHALSPFEAFFT